MSMKVKFKIGDGSKWSNPVVTNEGLVDVISIDGKVDVRLVIQNGTVTVLAKRGKMVVYGDRTCPAVHVEEA